MGGQKRHMNGEKIQLGGETTPLKRSPSNQSTVQMGSGHSANSA